MSNGAMKGTMLAQASDSQSATSLKSNRYDRSHSNTPEPSCSQNMASEMTKDKGSSHSKEVLGGIAFDHGTLPKIIAIHSMKDLKNVSPLANQPRSPQIHSTVSVPEMPERQSHDLEPVPLNSPMMLQNIPTMPQNSLPMPQNSMPMPQKTPHYGFNHQGQRVLGYFMRGNSQHQIRRFGSHTYDYMPSMHQKLSANSNPMQAEFQTDASVMQQGLPVNEISPQNASNSIGQFSTNHDILNEPPKLLPISANLNSATNTFSMQDKASPRFNHPPLISSNNQQLNGHSINHPPSYDDHRQPDRHPMQRAFYHPDINPPIPTNLIRFPYNRYPVIIPQQQHLYTHPVPIYPTHTLPPNVNNSLQMSRFPYNIVNEVPVYIGSEAPKLHRKKPYEKNRKVRNFYTDLLKLENKYDLLHVLKVNADSSRERLFGLVIKMLESNVLENSLCLLETIKTSDLTEKTKERVLSVIEEILWQAAPREDLWDDSKKSQINNGKNSNDADDEFERLQQDYLKELMTSALLTSHSTNADMSKSVNEATISADARKNNDIVEADILNNNVNKVCSPSENMSRPNSCENGRTSQSADEMRDEDNVTGISSSPGVVSEAETKRISMEFINGSSGEEWQLDKRSNAEKNDVSDSVPCSKTVDLRTTLGEVLNGGIKPPVSSVKQELSLSSCMFQDKQKHCFEEEVSDLKKAQAVVKFENSLQSTCLHEEQIKTEIKEPFQNNNHSVRNIFDLFT